MYLQSGDVQYVHCTRTARSVSRPVAILGINFKMGLHFYHCICHVHMKTSWWGQSAKPAIPEQGMRDCGSVVSELACIHV